jgi:hypothetical protein
MLGRQSRRRDPVAVADRRSARLRLSVVLLILPILPILLLIPHSQATSLTPTCSRTKPATTTGQTPRQTVPERCQASGKGTTENALVKVKDRRVCTCRRMINRRINPKTELNEHRRNTRPI